MLCLNANYKYDTYLNDAIVNFSLSNILLKLDHVLKQKVHVFDTHFYDQLTKKNANGKHDNVAKWTKDIDLFKKQLIVIPVCQNLHWFTILAINPGVITVMTVMYFMPLRVLISVGR